MAIAGPKIILAEKFQQIEAGSKSEASRVATSKTDPPGWLVLVAQAPRGRQAQGTKVEAYSIGSTHHHSRLSWRARIGDTYLDRLLRAWRQTAAPVAKSSRRGRSIWVHLQMQSGAIACLAVEWVCQCVWAFRAWFDVLKRAHSGLRGNHMMTETASSSTLYTGVQ